MQRGDNPGKEGFMKQVLLVRYGRCGGFVGEEVHYVQRLRQFNSKKAAQLYQNKIWERMGKPMVDIPYVGLVPNYPFHDILAKGKPSYDLVAQPLLQGSRVIWSEDPTRYIL
jgi:hypothetical protein